MAASPHPPVIEVQLVTRRRALSIAGGRPLTPSWFVFSIIEKFTCKGDQDSSFSNKCQRSTNN
jgi:hypothetical protein